MIEVLHPPSYDLSGHPQFFEARASEMQFLVQGLGNVTVIDSLKVPHPTYLVPWPSMLKGYALKVFALYSSTFREVTSGSF